MNLLERVFSGLENNGDDDKYETVTFNSSAIRQARFNPNNQHLYIQYTSGPQEYVFKADNRTWNRLLNSWSAGRFTHYVLRRNNRAPRRWY